MRRAFSGPVFNEFVMEFPRSVKMIDAELLKNKIIGPMALGKFYPKLTKRGLVCVTETTTKDEITRLVEGVDRALKIPL